ncbi:hypothetical protein LU293_04515 [Moraxella nasovis]|uniref:hypothetical protein n=1 Tax=Moraxella nasovis TaxID=2904121 RepID=UPI001F609AE7|nr:hypothetical protein [Moraxella nasovis]UNU74160.1 hypothetical protein LU293_04515 [Moraxella nasovis]
MYTLPAVGAILTHDELISTFSVANTGGMRRSLKNNVLVLIHKHDSVYHDRWQNGVLLYTGMGLHGDQDMNASQNKTLAQSRTNGVNVLLFSSKYANEYKFEGEVALAADPYYETQQDESGKTRQVVIFPLRLLNN